MARTITRKISLSGASATSVVKAGGKQYMGRLAGFATGTKENVHPQYGVSYGLIGGFRHIAADGTTTDAPIVWGPGVLIEPIKSALDSGAPSVQVLADVYAVASESSPVGFTYILETHGEESEDPISRLLASAPAVPALAAPATPNKGAKKA